MPRVLISDYSLYEKPTEESIRKIASGLIQLDGEKLPDYTKLRLTTPEHIALGSLPKMRMLKMSKKEHVDQFFRDGSLALGTFHFYNQHENLQIRDIDEGRFLLIGKTSEMASFCTVHGGFNNYVFSTFDGDPDPRCIADFGYDCCYEILDPIGFAVSISKKIGAKSYLMAPCVYSEHKVFVATVEDPRAFSRISAEIMNHGRSAKYFIKPDTYANQCEYRIIFTMKDDVKKQRIIKCPEAISFCRRL